MTWPNFDVPLNEIKRPLFELEGVVNAAISTGITDVTKAPYNADNTGATSPYTAIASAISDGRTRIHLPAGIYKFSQADVTAHNWLIDFYFGASNLELFGDGIGKTILTVVENVTYNSTIFININNGNHQSVHDLTIQGPAAYTSGDVTGIAAYGTSLYPHLYNFEITRLSGDASAGAEGVSTGQLFQIGEVNTTIAASITAGTRTVTPGSMSGIYVGALLRIDYQDPEIPAGEFVVVTAITATTFTATFANNHLANAPVNEHVTYFSGARIENFHIHDCPKATAIVINSTGNTISNGRIRKVGLASTQHGLYVQAGHNTFSNLSIEGAYGYSIHQYPTGGGLVDSSGNVYDRITSIDPSYYHVLISDEYADVSDGRNKFFPTVGTGLSRYTMITNCEFRNTYGSASFGGINLIGPTLFDGNVLENVKAFISQSPYTVVTPNNIVRYQYSQSGLALNLPVSWGGGAREFDATPEQRFLIGQSAYSQAATNTTGGHLDFGPGIGVRKFTVIDNLSGGVTLTINISPDNGSNQFSLVSGTDFNLGSSNTAAQLHQTALNIATAINTTTNVYQYAQAYVVAADVYLLRHPAHLAADITISSNQAGRISATSGPNGRVRTHQGLQWMTGARPTAGSDYRGMIWYVAGGSGVADKFEVCRKDTANAYAWASLFSPRSASATSSATPTINTDDVDCYSLTAQAVDITSFTTNLSGTPIDGQRLRISITGTAARAITWGTSFEASTVALPTTTVTTNRLDVDFIWNSATTKWRCFLVA